ncbi:MAG: hypothetical protein IKE36_05105 [Solobacterium sp.]|nr:hypothetical protein [Solobacterium sp.]
MANKVCDFCLEEQKGFFTRLHTTLDGHLACGNCRRIIAKYDLPLKFDVFQRLVTSDKEIRNIIMRDYLESHTPEQCIGKFYPLPEMKLHEGEVCVNVIPAKLTVSGSAIPEELAVKTIAEVNRSTIHNVSDITEEGDPVTIEARLYETNAALYFLTNHFVNCHRLSNIVRTNTDGQTIKVLENGKGYTYTVSSTTMFMLRSEFYRVISSAQEKKRNLIYINSENTMTITPGTYDVPKHIQAGTYYVSAVKDDGLHIRDAAGKLHSMHNGRVRLDEGSQLEVTGEYHFRFNQVGNDILKELQRELDLEEKETEETEEK